MSKAEKSADPSAKKKSKLPLLIGLVVLLGGGGGGGYWWWARQQPVAASAGPDAHGPAKDAHAAPPDADAGGGALLPLDSFTVNLADTDGVRYLRTNVQLVIAGDEAVVKELEHEKLPIMRTRSAVLEILSEQKAAALATPEGKDALKKLIAERAGKALHHEVVDVLFSDFVIQF